MNEEIERWKKDKTFGGAMDWFTIEFELKKEDRIKHSKWALEDLQWKAMEIERLKELEEKKREILC